jgi:IMP dehydrogenase
MLKLTTNGCALGVDDILLTPCRGALQSRTEAQLTPFIYSAPMDTVTGYHLTKAMLAEGEFPVICRYLKEKEWEATIKDFASNPNTFIAVPGRQDLLSDFLHKLAPLVNTKINFAIDVAHGDSVFAHSMSYFLAEQPFTRNIMSGSLCTWGGAQRAVANGCTHLRVGIGNGSMCTTRLMTGCGVPQLTAIHNVAQGLGLPLAQNITIIADGGIRYPGDAVKYIAAGAHGIMLGHSFSQAQESPGWQQSLPEIDVSKTLTFPMQEPKLKLIKQYRGHASAEFQTTWKGEANRCPEGAVSETFEWQGETVKSICEKFRGGIASAISYLGTQSMQQLREETIGYTRVTTSTYIEGTPHGLRTTYTNY